MIKIAHALQNPFYRVKMRVLYGISYILAMAMSYKLFDFLELQEDQRESLSRHGVWLLTADEDSMSANQNTRFWQPCWESCLRVVMEIWAAA